MNRVRFLLAAAFVGLYLIGWFGLEMENFHRTFWLVVLVYWVGSGLLWHFSKTNNVVLRFSRFAIGAVDIPGRVTLIQWINLPLSESSHATTLFTLSIFLFLTVMSAFTMRHHHLYACAAIGIVCIWILESRADAPLISYYSAPVMLIATAWMMSRLPRRQTALVREAAERKARRDRLARHFSPGVAELIESHDEPGEGEDCELSILFCDIRGFTQISESMEARDVVALLNEFHGAMVDAIFRFGGTLDKYLGDGLLAYFNAPARQKDHAERAVRCALAMVEDLEDLNQDRARSGAAPIRVGIGVHCRTGGCRRDRCRSPAGIHRHRRHRKRRQPAPGTDEEIRVRHSRQRIHRGAGGKGGWPSPSKASEKWKFEGAVRRSKYLFPLPSRLAHVDCRNMFRFLSIVALLLAGLPPRRAGAFRVSSVCGQDRYGSGSQDSWPQRRSFDCSTRGPKWKNVRIEDHRSESRRSAVRQEMAGKSQGNRANKGPPPGFRRSGRQPPDRRGRCGGIQTISFRLPRCTAAGLALRENGDLVAYSGRNNGMKDVRYVGGNAKWLVFVKRDGTLSGSLGRPVFTGSVTNAVQAVCGSFHNTVRLGDGTIRVWGRAYGDPKEPIGPNEPLEDIIDIASTQGAMAAVGGDGRVHCWDMKNTQIKSRKLEDEIVSVEGSIFNFVALTRSGEVIEWTGANMERIRRPIDLDGGKAIAVRAGGATGAARREDGSWVAWGKNAQGIVEKINSLGPNVADIAFFSEPGQSELGYVAWIEPEEE